METASPCQRRVRSLHPWEIEAARIIFSSNLQYERVRIHECSTWTNGLDRLGRRLKGMPPMEVNNAITLGNHIFFPVQFPDQPCHYGDPEHYKISWLMHELTHAWQFQHQGWPYLWRALSAQFKGKETAYDFGAEDGLKKRRKDGWAFHKFNLEQQGDIARSYYERVCQGKDVSAWEPFVQEIQRITRA